MTRKAYRRRDRGTIPASEKPPPALFLRGRPSRAADGAPPAAYR